MKDFKDRLIAKPVEKWKRKEVLLGQMWTYELAGEACLTVNGNGILFSHPFKITSRSELDMFARILSDAWKDFSSLKRGHSSSESSSSSDDPSSPSN